MMQFYKTSRNTAPPQTVHLITSDAGWDGALQGRFKLALDAFKGRCTQAVNDRKAQAEAQAAATAATALAHQAAGDAAEGDAVHAAATARAAEATVHQERFLAALKAL